MYAVIAIDIRIKDETHKKKRIGKWSCVCYEFVFSLQLISSIVTFFGSYADILVSIRLHKVKSNIFTVEKQNQRRNVTPLHFEEVHFRIWIQCLSHLLIICDMSHNSLFTRRLKIQYPKLRTVYCTSIFWFDCDVFHQNNIFW